MLPEEMSTPTVKMVQDRVGDKKVAPTLEQEAKGKTLDEFIKGQGTPVYHGTNAKFDTFDKSKVNSVESFGDYSGTGFYFTTDKAKAGRYAQQAVKFNGGAENIIESFLEMKNPLIIKTNADAKTLRESFGGDEEYFMMKPQNIQDELIKRGYDSVDDQLYGQKVVFSPEQIKTKSKLESIWEKSN